MHVSSRGLLQVVGTATKPLRRLVGGAIVLLVIVPFCKLLAALGSPTALEAVRLTDSYAILLPQSTLGVLVLSPIAAFVASRLRPVSAIGRMLNAIFRVKMPELDPPEQKIESWGYGIGRRFVWLSDIIRKAFTGPVSRDVAYIAVSLAAIALGVVLC